MREPKVEVVDIEQSRLQKLYRFPNGLGASVAGTHNKPSGPWKLAILRYHGEEFYDFYVEAPSEMASYDSLSESDVDAILDQIEELDRGGFIPSA